jgi:hypothetical protein
MTRTIGSFLRRVLVALAAGLSLLSCAGGEPRTEWAEPMPLGWTLAGDSLA